MSCGKGLLLIVTIVCLISAGFAQQLSSSTSDTPGATEGAAQLPASPVRSNHVVVIMEENRSISEASEYMPYLKSLAEQYSQGMQVYSDSHGSWLAYGELTSGLAPFGGEGDGGICTGDGCTQTITIDNLVRHFSSQGITWRGYFQSMPQIGYLGYQYGEYVRRHNPFAFYSDVVDYPAEQQNLLPADPYMLQDIENNHLANFTWISPDLDHDAHNGSDDQQALAAADAYLQTFVPQLLTSPPFQPGGDGVLVVTFDEGELSGDNECGGNNDPNNCGGHIWHVVIGPQVRNAYESNTHYKQGSELRMFCDLLGLTSCPGDGATSPAMSEFFQGDTCSASQDHTVVICSPPANSNVPSPVQITAAAKDNEYPITGMVAYANRQIVARSDGATLSASVPLNPGQYELVVRAWDSSGNYFSSQESFTATSACTATQDHTVVICSPQANGSIPSPVQITAAAKDNEYPITGMVAYANGQIVARSSGSTLSGSVRLNPGQYQLVVRAWDSSGNYFSSQEGFRVTAGGPPILTSNPARSSEDGAR
ncbi:MAG: alkaline phosphatase family protein [Candidatus Korobacteraceae bacterium]